MKRPTGFDFVSSYASILLILGSLQLLTLGVSASDNTLTLISGCTCPGYSVTFTCSIQGGGNTIWKGSAFDCPSTSDSNNNQILLLHSRFGGNRNPTGTCNDGDIQGQGVSGEGGRFISQLIVTITPSVVGQQVQCVYDNTSAEILIGTGVITVTTGDDLMTPGNVSLITASPNELTFNWTAVTHSCSAVNYTLTTSSGCGDCQVTTNDPSATCLIETIQPNEVVRSCTASVQAVVCGNIQGGQSETSTFQLSVPDAPQNITIIPSYAQGNKTLLSITVNFSAVTLFRPISKYVAGYPENYTIVFTNSTSDNVCNEVSTSLTACSNQMCSSTFSVSSPHCPPLTDINVTVFTTSVLGNGARSNEMTIYGMNSLVEMSDLVDSGATTMIFCIFSNIEEGANLSCSILYSKCEHRDISTLQQRSESTNRDGNTLQIDLNFDRSGGGVYCYTTTASIGSNTLKIEGTFNRGVTGLSAGEIAGIVVTVVVVVAAVSIGLPVIVIIVIGMRTKKMKHRRSTLKEHFDDKEELVDGQQFRIIPVPRNCELKWLMNNHNLFYKPGCVYYQFTRQVEIIKKDKDIIFLDKDAPERLFRTKDGHDLLLSGASGSNKIQNPKFARHQVFVQSKGIGHRPLFKGTSILYDTEVTKEEDVDVSISPDDLMDPERKRKFKVLRVPRDCSLIEFIEDQSGLQFRPGCAFFEFTHDWEDIDKDKEVILMDKNRDFYTGPVTRQMIKAPASKIPRPHFAEWTVFVQSRHYGSRHLPANSTLLYEVKSDEDEFESVRSIHRTINKVMITKGCQLRDFVEDHPDLEYSDPDTKFYFEFNSKAEFISEEKEVLLMNMKNEMLFTGRKVKEFIGAPVDYGQRVNHPQLRGYRIFISNAGSGTRYLEPHSYLLWEATGTKL